jgi:hypothetical protein
VLKLVEEGVDVSFRHGGVSPGSVTDDSPVRADADERGCMPSA